MPHGVTRDPLLSQSPRLRGPLVLFVVLLFIFGATSGAQEPLSEQKGEPGVLKGIVINSVTRAPVSRALVHSLDNRFATLTDDQGRFVFRIPST